MYCTKCGVELEGTSLYCSKCGQPTRSGYPRRSAPVLSRPMEQRKIAAVCAGFARYFDVDVTLMRILWLAALILSGGLMFFVYLFAWILMPKDWPAHPGASTERVSAY